jgi:hypothetical protein
MELNWLSHLDVIRHGVDFGMLVLIWLVQLTIYPGFAYMSPEAFPSWHEKYMNRMGFIVGPLMLTQPVLIALQIWLNPSAFHYIAAALVGLAWLSTALFSVPNHRSLQKNGYDARAIAQLVLTNWIRTAAWSAVFILGLFDCCC